MGWQASDNPRPGSEPGPGECLPSLPEGFAHGGPWDAVAPSALLAAALEAAAGPDDRYEGADIDALVGVARQWAAVESWAAAGLLGALRAMTREGGDGQPLLRRRAGLPDGWDDSLNYEVAAALAMGPVSAGNLASLAWTLGTRLPGVGRLLAGGTLTRAKAKLIAAVFEPLDDGEAARAEALVLPEVPGKTYFQVERLAWRAALAVAPDVAERRRSAAERERARVTVFREESGAVGLSGRDLPAAQALAGHANVVARARSTRPPARSPGRRPPPWRRSVTCTSSTGVTAADAIAFARTAAEPPGSPGQGEDGNRGRPGDGQGPGDDGPGDAGSKGGGGDPGDGNGPGGQDGGSGAGGNHPVLPEVTVPLATLQGTAARAGDNRLLGPLDPALARDLAAAAARSPHSRWEVTIVDDNGYAAGHGIARPRPSRSQQPQPPPPAAAPRRPAGLRAARAGQHHHHRDTAAPVGRPGGRGGRGGGAPLGRPARRLETRPANTGHLDTQPARRPAAGRPARRRAHPRLRPRARGQHLPAQRPATPPGPGPRPPVHLPALLTPCS